MRAIKVYCPPGVEPPLYAFIDALDGKLKAKLLWQIFRLRNLPACELKEPHFKHFSLERYSQMYELREKGKVLIRIVFTVQNEDVILLTSFIKRQPRDTKKALDQSLYIRKLSRIAISNGVNVENIAKEVFQKDINRITKEDLLLAIKELDKALTQKRERDGIDNTETSNNR